MEKKIIVSICVIGMMLVSSGVTISAKTSEYSSNNTMSQKLNECPINITVHEAWDMLTDTGNGNQIPIDVRSKNEWDTGYIDTPWPECPIWYTLDLFENDTWLQTFMDNYASEEVIIYCLRGSRSYYVSLILCEAGFTGTVYNMLGGISDWKAQGYPIRNNTKPDAPTIDGPTTVKVNEPIDYTFSAIDSENDGLYYWIDWCGEGHCGQWQGPYASGKEVTFNHTWETAGKYIMKAKVKDFYDNESDWTEFELTVPRNKIFHYSFLEQLFIRFPHTFQIFKKIIGL